jgi:hypothetical protein
MENSGKQRRAAALPLRFIEGAASPASDCAAKMARMPQLPRIPLGVIVGGAGAIAATAGSGYLLWNSVYSGMWGLSR